jgi:hypothetical protein
MKLEVVGMVRMEGENTEKKNMDAVKELGEKRDLVDVVVIGGPTNSLVRHGKEGERGFGGERAVKIVWKGGGKEEWQVRCHLTNMVKINTVEKTELIDRVVDLVDNVKRTVGDKVTVVFMSMLPRFVWECCKGHMTDKDVWLLDGARRDVDTEIVDRLSDMCRCMGFSPLK